MKVTRCILKIAAAAASIAAIVFAVVAYWDKISDAFYTIADKLEEKKANHCRFDDPDFDDYDDI